MLEDAPAGSKVEAEQAVEDAIGGHPGFLHELGEFVHDIGGGQIGLGGVGIVVLLNHALEVHGREHRILLEEEEHLLHQHIAVLHELVDQIGSLGNRLSDERLDLLQGDSIVLVNILQRHQAEVQGLGLDLGGIHTVLAVAVLDNHPAVVPDRAVVLDPHILHRLHHTTLDVTRVRRLHSRVDQTLTTAHGVEEVLGRTETLDEGGLDESAGLYAVIVLGEVGQSAVLEGILDTLTVYDLLAEKSHHLRDVETRTLGARLHHLN